MSANTALKDAVLPAAVLLSALLLCSASPNAHRGHAVWTDITWNGSAFEIVHRMHLSDAINVSRSLGNDLPIGERRSLALLALYVEDRFRVLDASDAGTGAQHGAGGNTVILQTIGAEIDDDFLLVYQEWRTPLPERFPPVDNRILMDVEPGTQIFTTIKGPGIDEER